MGSRFKRGELVAEHTVAFASGDLGYTVGLERGAVAVDDGHKRPMTIHVTRTYRRIDDAWRLVHRHAELPRRTSNCARAHHLVPNRERCPASRFPGWRIRPCTSE